MQGGARPGAERTRVLEHRKRSDNAADASPQPHLGQKLELISQICSGSRAHEFDHLALEWVTNWPGDRDRDPNGAWT